MGAENSPTDRPPGGRYRLVVLGGGAAGICAAREAARRGVPFALILPTPGDTPSRTPTALSEQIRRAQGRFGQLRPVDPPNGPGIDVYLGRATFCGRHTVAVDGRELRFRKAVIATGATAAPVEIDGADGDDCLTPERLGELTELPSRMAVIGGGPAGCGWAQTFRRLGSQVHLISRERTVLPEEDPDAAAVIQARLEQDDVRLHLGCDELTIESAGKFRAVLIGQDRQREKLLVDRILLCGPRRPNTAGLSLETAAVAYTDRGIVVGDRLQTTGRNIFAAGAVCGPEFATPQAAEATARLAVHNALSLTGRRLSQLVIPRCIYTHPALAQVGLSPGGAAARRIEIDTYRAELDEADEVIPASRRQGFIAVHVRRRTGRIVGATVVAADADELLAPLVLLITRKWPLSALADVIPCHPSRFELLTRLAERHARTRRSLRRAGVLQRWQAWLCDRFPCGPGHRPGIDERPPVP